LLIRSKSVDYDVPNYNHHKTVPTNTFTNHQLQLLYMMVLQAKTIIPLSSEIWNQTMDFIVGRVNNIGNIKVLCTQCKFFLFSVDYLNDLL